MHSVPSEAAACLRAACSQVRVCDECGHLALPANDPSAQVSVARDVELFDCVGDIAGQLVASFDPQLGEVDQLTKGWWDGSGELVSAET